MTQIDEEISRTEKEIEDIKNKILENKENIEEEMNLINAIKNLGMDECLILLRDSKRKTIFSVLKLCKEIYDKKLDEMKGEIDEWHKKWSYFPTVAIEQLKSKVMGE